MSHELEIVNGEARMMYVGQAPWHGLGTQIEKEVTWDAAKRLAGLDWSVSKKPMFLQGEAKIDGIPVIGQKVETHCLMVRNEDSKALGVVGNNYAPIQNDEAGKFLDSLVGEGLAMYHTAGSLFGGRRVFVCCKLPESIQVGPDQIDKYLAALWSHDGTMSLHIKWTPIRVVCWNTASAAFNISEGRVHAGSDSVTVRHTKNWQSKTEEARKVLDLTQIYYKRVEETFNRLLKTPITDAAFADFAKVVFPDSPKEDGGSVDREAIRTELMNIFHNGIGLDHPDVKGTQWAAWNAVTQYVDHGRRYNDGKYGSAADNRMDSVIWGSGSLLKKKALNLLVA